MPIVFFSDKGFWKLGARLSPLAQGLIFWRGFGYISEKFAPKKFAASRRFLDFSDNFEMFIYFSKHFVAATKLSWGGLTELIITQMFVPTTVRMIITSHHMTLSTQDLSCPHRLQQLPRHCHDSRFWTLLVPTGKYNIIIMISVNSVIMSPP